MAYEVLNKTLDEAIRIIKSYGSINIDEEKNIKIGKMVLPKIYLGNQIISGDLTVVNSISSQLDCICSFLQVRPEGLVRIRRILWIVPGNPSLVPLLIIITQSVSV